MPNDYQGWIQGKTVSASLIDHFLDPSRNNVSQFDPDTGYSSRTCVLREGMDDTLTWTGFGPGGERRAFNGLDAPCRISAYGNSFTQCAQVSDGETWEEYLAAHLREPIRNYGVSGQGVWQAYHRLRAREQWGEGTPYVLFYLWGDDHHRSIMPWRGFFWHWWLVDPEHADSFGITPWRHLALDPGTGTFAERPNFCPTPSSLYELCRGEFLLHNLEGSLVVQLVALMEGVDGVPRDQAREAAARYGLPLAGTDRDSLAVDARRLYDHVAYESSIHTLGELQRLASERGRSCLVLLGGEDRALQAYLQTGRMETGWKRVVDHLGERGIPFVDIFERHREEYRTFGLDPKSYTDRYYIGHYSPRGNHFFAYAIKDAVVKLLDPPPPPYRRG